jgi:probable phosphoglycerate mutase
MVRHGESVATVERYVGGHRSCRGLSELGRRQAERLRDRLAKTGELSVDVLVASQFPRAIQTAEILDEVIGTGMVIDESIGEHDPGPMCDGVPFAEFVERFGQRNWENPYVESFPGGETIGEFHLRVNTGLHRLLDTYPDQTLLICCHGGVIDAALRMFMRVTQTGGFDLHTLNTSITEFVRTRPDRWKLVRYNDAAHLAGLPAETPRRETRDPGGDSVRPPSKASDE